MKPPLRQGSSNDFQTPIVALNPLLPYLKKDWVIWECAEGKGNITRALSELGFRVIGSDINSETILPENDLEKHYREKDFLSWQPENEEVNFIITNPPYSIKQQFLERCYKLGKPFALLLPLTTFETKKRQDLFKKYGLETVFFDKRINFETPSGRGSGAWFSTAWFTWGLNIGKVMTFTVLGDNHPILPFE